MCRSLGTLSAVCPYSRIRQLNRPCCLEQYALSGTGLPSRLKGEISDVPTQCSPD